MKLLAEPTAEVKSEIACTFAPLNETEEKAGNKSITKFPSGTQECLSSSEKQDKIFKTNVTQNKVYNETAKAKIKALLKLNHNLRVLIKPLVIIRIIQLIMSIIAIATTTSFKSATAIEIRCHDFEKDLPWEFGYPFKMEGYNLRVPEKCTDISEVTFKSYNFPFDISRNAEFFVAVGVLTLIYTLCLMFVYVIMHRFYSANALIAVVDLVATVILSIFWLAGTYFWADGIIDIKYYANPNNLFPYIAICEEPQTCHAASSGNFDSLIISLIFGFASCMLWVISIWFAYKETSFNKKIVIPGTKPHQMDLQQQA